MQEGFTNVQNTTCKANSEISQYRSVQNPHACKFNLKLYAFVSDMLHELRNFRFKLLYLVLFQVFNEVVVDRGQSPYLCNIDLYVEGKLVTTVQGDGEFRLYECH